MIFKEANNHVVGDERSFEAFVTKNKNKKTKTKKKKNKKKKKKKNKKKTHTTPTIKSGLVMMKKIPLI